MTRQLQHPRGSGSTAARARSVAAAILALCAVAAPLHAQAPSRFSPRLQEDAPRGPSLAFYAGFASGQSGSPGTAFGVQLELGRAGPVRGLMGFMASPAGGGLEGGLVIQSRREAAPWPYLAMTGYLGGFEAGENGLALHVGSDIGRTRELAFRVEGRAFLGDRAVLAGLFGVAIR